MSRTSVTRPSLPLTTARAPVGGRCRERLRAALYGSGELRVVGGGGDR